MGVGEDGPGGVRSEGKPCDLGTTKTDSTCAIFIVCLQSKVMVSEHAFCYMCVYKCNKEAKQGYRRTSRSLKNKCVSAKLKIISSILSPSDTDVGGSCKKDKKRLSIDIFIEKIIEYTHTVHFYHWSS